MTSIVTIRMGEELKGEIQDLASRIGLPKSFVIKWAIRDFFRRGGAGTLLRALECEEMRGREAEGRDED